MKKTRQTLSLLVFAAFGILYIGSTSTSKEVLLAPQFDYAAPQMSADGTDLTLAMVSPFYLTSSGQRVSYEPYKSFQKSLEDETYELLTAKGFGVRGPFVSRDDMVYSDKEQCDLALIIEISPELQVASGGFSRKSSIVDGSYLGERFKGAITSYGKINLSMVEPLSGEKVWSKSVSIPESTTEEIQSLSLYKGTNSDPYVKLLTLIAGGDVNIANPVTRMLQDSFEEIMNTINRHLDPAEFERMKDQIARLKSN